MLEFGQKTQGQKEWRAPVMSQFVAQDAENNVGAGADGGGPGTSAS